MRYLILLALFAQTASAESLIKLSSSNHFIGGNGNYTFSGPTEIPTVQIEDNHIYIYTKDFQFEFKSGKNRTFTRGAFFDTALTSRADFIPSIDIAAPGRSCSQYSNGEYYIHEIDKATKKLSMDFVNYCSTNSGPFKGSIRIDSLLPIPYNGTLAIIETKNLKAVENSTIELDASRSIPKVNTNVYSWEQTKGKPGFIHNPLSSKTLITLPKGVDLGGEDIEVKLSVRAAGSEATDSTSIKVRTTSKSDPVSYAKIDSLYLDENNSNFAFSKSLDINNNDVVGIEIDGTLNVHAHFAAPKNSLLSPGFYDNAERFPFQKSSLPGISIMWGDFACNEVIGSFSIIKSVFVVPYQFKTTFEQRCDLNDTPLKGEIAFNFVNDSVPVVVVNEDQNVKEGDPIVLDGSGTTDNEGTPLTYLWSSDEPSITIQDENFSRARSIAPKLTQGELQRKIIFSLLVTDNEGFQAKKSLTATVTTNNSSSLSSSTGRGKGGGAIDYLLVILLLSMVMLFAQLRSDSI
jgi:hypothetical protein